MTGRTAATLEIFRSILDTVERIDDPAERDEIFGALRADLAARPRAGRRDDDPTDVAAIAADLAAGMRRSRRKAGVR
jgi:hypothetical protein